MPNLFFSLPIILGIIAGFFFPFKAMEMIWLSNGILFLLVFANGLTANGASFNSSLISPFISWTRPKIIRSLSFLSLLYVVFPAILINLGFWLSTDENYRLGMIFSCIAPTAFVAPYFCKVRGGNPEEAIHNVLLSTLAFPAIALAASAFFFSRDHFLDIPSVFGLVFLITLVPLLLSAGVRCWLPRIAQGTAPWQGIVNSLLLALLMFILCGSSFHRLRFSYFAETEFLAILLWLIILDFGVYMIAGAIFANKVTDPRAPETLSISVSLRNLAIPAGLLLSLQPKASLVPCLGLVIHALFFQFLSRLKKQK